MLIDSHCHLEFEDFKNDLGEVLQRAKDIGLARIVTISTHISEFYKLAKIFSLSPEIYASIGVHPDHVMSEGLYTSAMIEALCSSKKVIGIGETGLDFYRSYESKDLQIKSFIEHIKAAQNTDLPVIVHSRDAETETLEILSHMMAIKPFRAVIHCFTGSLDFAHKCIDIGCYISFSGIVTFKNATSLQEVAKEMPIDRMLIETDAPFLAPTPMRGKRNEPSFVAHTAQFLADLKNVPYAEFCDITSNNFFDLFWKAKA
ncbi:MAG: TatD family hydrolase [Alphaproteobacteria bacterium]|jgi:TatD DNase family protein|nr:TatD family hydrolase [Candidatus Jidaibacter sp.]